MARKKGGALSADERNQLVRILESEKRRILRSNQQLEAMLAESGQSGLAGDSADIAGAATSREEAQYTASRVGQRLREVLAALDRVMSAPDAFGRCDGCRGAIAFERLEVLPTTMHCTACAS